MFLKNVARALNATKFAFGAGSIIGNTLSFVKDSVVTLFKKNVSSETSAPKDKVTFKENSHNAVQATLQALDYKLWNQAPLLLESNEFGVSASLGILIENGVQYNGMGGSEELGLSFGYNKTDKAFVFEIFHNSEKFSYTPAVISIAAIVVRAGLTVFQKENTQPVTVKTGNSFYPPVVPVFKSEGTDNFSTGFSTSLGFPPNPLVDLLTYSNKYTRNTIVRITVSPLMKGYVRLYIGDIVGSVKIVTFRMMEIFKWVSQRVTLYSKGGRSCEGAFL
jgi:hypothetical protein